MMALISRNMLGRTDMTKLIVAFDNFANTPNKQSIGNKAVPWLRWLVARLLPWRPGF
jgi:hypothetical protein